MAGDYGVSFAAKLIEKGDYEEAIAEATKALEREPENPEHHFERASAAAMIERFADAVADFARAIELDRDQGVLDLDVVDDGYFSALLGAARAQPLEAGLTLLAGYPRVFPSGRHLRDAGDWARRLRGELKADFVKRRPEDV